MHNFVQYTVAVSTESHSVIDLHAYKEAQSTSSIKAEV